MKKFEKKLEVAPVFGPGPENGPVKPKYNIAYVSTLSSGYLMVKTRDRSGSPFLTQLRDGRTDGHAFSNVLSDSKPFALGPIDLARFLLVGTDGRTNRAL